MIVLTPSKRIIKDTKLDFDIINSILSSFIDFKINCEVSVHKARSKVRYSAFYPDDKIIILSYKNDSSLAYILGSLLHEVRHVIQTLKVKNLDFTYENYKEYYNSPEELDARKFEKLTSSFCSSYRNLAKLKMKYKELKLNSLNNL